MRVTQKQAVEIERCEDQEGLQVTFYKSRTTLCAWVATVLLTTVAQAQTQMHPHQNSQGCVTDIAIRQSDTSPVYRYDARSPNGENGKIVSA